MSSSPNTALIDPAKWGVIFSLKQCSNFQADQADVLNWLLKQGWRRFRLMSYWDEHEKSPGEFDFSALDEQVAIISAAGGFITFCLGARQPRWQENHWPDWAWEAKKTVRTKALMKFIKTVMNRYKDESAIISWQLENEALLENFGNRPEVDRQRLRDEFKLVKKLDPARPCIMTTSTSWGIPFRKPIPDAVGFSYYQIVFNKGVYSTSLHKPWLDKLRAGLIKLIWRRSSFIHELQCEPWGPKAIWEMPTEEQDKSMGIKQITHNISTCKKSGLYPMDFWGAEWWYWRNHQGDDTIWEAVKSQIQPVQE